MTKLMHSPNNAMHKLKEVSRAQWVAISAVLTVALFAVVAVAAVATGLVGPSAAIAQSNNSSAVTGLVVAAGSTLGELEVSWDTHPADARDYRLSWAVNGQGWKTYTDETGNAFPTGNSHTITGLAHSTTYKVRIRARFDESPRLGFTHFQAA